MAQQGFSPVSVLTLHPFLRGDQLHSPSREQIVNETGSQLNKLKVIKTVIWGTTQNLPAGSLATGPNDRVLGVLEADLPNNGVGFVTSIGFLENVDTSMWPTGTVLYPSVSGSLSTLQYNFPIAVVLKQDSTDGKLFVRAQGLVPSDILLSVSGNTIVPVSIVDWVSSDGGDLYSVDINHGLNTNYPIVRAYLDSLIDEEVELHSIRTISSNITRISVCNAGVDGRFNGFIVFDQ
jgi:hypothetical protein